MTEKDGGNYHCARTFTAVCVAPKHKNNALYFYSGGWSQEGPILSVGSVGHVNADLFN